ncbi:hypothetical protein CFH99_07925 [Nocardioides aromaticivorans]|uniref:Uncharacterized protein n=1 Tax=Nocardioides aromaticivorans TaxID=200618 RepID=A0ABX7PHV3_9ACTN|nr:hypothetical protein [Nocardioides aromaticivorans]QSR25549.1 hypothetical protein CFH99_07925 [Nocardioides aromaticivorans]
MRRRESRESELRKSLFSAIADEADGSGTHDETLLALDYLLEHYALRAQRITATRMQNRIVHEIDRAIDTAVVPADVREGLRIARHVAVKTSKEFA